MKRILLAGTLAVLSLGFCFAEATVWGNTKRSLGFGYSAEPSGSDSIAIGDEAMYGSSNVYECVGIGTSCLSGLLDSYRVIAIGEGKFSGCSGLTNVTSIGHHFFASDQSDCFMIRAAESDPRRAPILYGANHLYLNSTNLHINSTNVLVNGRRLGEAAFRDSVGAVASVNGQTGSVTVTCSSIGALPANGTAQQALDAVSANFANGANYAYSLKSQDGLWSYEVSAYDGVEIPRITLEYNGLTKKVAFTNDFNNLDEIYVQTANIGSLILDGVPFTGVDSTALHGDTQTVVIGNGASVTSVAPGYTMPTNHSVAIGARAKTTLPTTTSRTSARQIDSRAVAIGYNAEASGTYGAAQSVAIGPNTKASGAASVALGGGSCDYDETGSITNTEATAATGDFGLAIGYRAKAKGNYSTALGYKTTTEGGNTVAIGGNRTFARNDSTSIGFDATASESSVAVGKTSSAGNFSVAIGNSASSTNFNSVAIGSSASNSDVRSLAIGSGAKTERNDGIAIGTSSSARRPYATALGYGADAKPDYAILIGTLSYAESNATHSIGIGNEAIVSNKNALAIGERAKAVGENDLVIGYNAKSSGTSLKGNAVVIGNGADARTVHNVSIGLGAISRAPGAIAIGNNYGGGGATDSSGYYSVAFGNGAKASQESSVAIGTKAVNAKSKSVQLGEGTTAAANTLQFRSVPLVTEISSGVGTLNKDIVKPFSGMNFDFNSGSNATKVLYDNLTNVIIRLGGTVTNPIVFN